MGKEINLFEERNTAVFNSPLEIGLRVLYILNELYPKGCDLQRLIYYDYILIHSSDIANGPQSIHPNLPHRTSEILVKREVIRQGITLMSSKQLIKANFDATGIVYTATNLTAHFLDYIATDYAEKLKGVSKWMINKFEKYDDEELSIFIKDNLDKWGGEFTKESLLRGMINE